MVLEPGEKVHVMVRRMFDRDLRRHFLGTVIAVGDNAVRLEGYVFVYDIGTGRYNRRPEKRVRVLSLTDANNIINVLPANANMDRVAYTQSDQGRLVLTDSESFTMDINEFGPTQ